MIGTAKETCDAVFVYGKNGASTQFNLTGLRLTETPASAGAASYVSFARACGPRHVGAGLCVLGPRGKVNAMPRRRLNSTSKPNLQVIPGALSLYRPGDQITFNLNGVEFTAPVESIETEETKAVLWVTVSVGVYASHVKRVERGRGL